MTAWLLVFQVSWIRSQRCSTSGLVVSGADEPRPSELSGGRAGRCGLAAAGGGGPPDPGGVHAEPGGGAVVAVPELRPTLFQLGVLG